LIQSSQQEKKKIEKRRVDLHDEPPTDTNTDLTEKMGGNFFSKFYNKIIVDLVLGRPSSDG
jgi:adenine/guanine phosphoribosyltransferase-like PRPP-binding protein